MIAQRALFAIVVENDETRRSEIVARLFSPGGPFVNAGTFCRTEEAAAWARAGGRADVVIRSVNDLSTAPATPAPPPPPSSGGLTRRERDVLILLAKGLQYADIGRALGIRLGTVQCHIKRLYSKLDVNSKAEAALVAASLGLV